MKLLKEFVLELKKELQNSRTIAEGTLEGIVGSNQIKIPERISDGTVKGISEGVHRVIRIKLAESISIENAERIAQ